jgi:hypothetical protein
VEGGEDGEEAEDDGEGGAGRHGRWQSASRGAVDWRLLLDLNEEEKNCLPSMYLKPYHLNAVFIISPFSVCIIMCLQSQSYLPWYLFSFASVIDPSVSLVSLFFLWLFCERTTTIHLSLEST